MGEKEEQKDDKPAEPQPSTVVLRVKMHCQGCERKVRKSLAKLDGLSELKIDRAEEKVIVKGFVDPKNVLKKVLKTGKPAEFWPAPAPPPPAKEEEAKKEEPKKEEKKVEEPKAEELKKEEPPKEEAPKKEEKKEEEAPKKEEKKEEEPAKKEEPKKEESAKKEEPKKEEPKKEEEPAAKKGGEDKSEKETKGSEESVTLLNQPPMQFETVRIIAPQYFSDDNPNACSVM